MLKLRVLTATVLIILFVLATFHLPHIWLAALLGLVVISAAVEWISLARFEGGQGFIWMALLAATMLVTWFYLEYLSVFWLALGVLWWCVAAYKVLLAPVQPEILATRVVSGVLVLVPSWVALIKLHGEDIQMFLAVFLLVWLADIGAYFCGRAWGRRKLAPLVSPGKSTEGAIGGLFLALILAFCVAFWKEFSLTQGILWTMLCVVTVVFSILGDLWESKLKRLAGIKDSGYILPGHGGILDRIDSITAAAPVFALGLYLFL